MRNHSVMPRTIWSGVMNYLKASAQNADALRPWSFREQKEARTVLVLKTTVTGFSDQQLVADQLNALLGKNNWTIDLDDVDKVLRVVGLQSSLQEIMQILHEHEFDGEIMN
jgi:hypothetical protein